MCVCARMDSDGGSVISDRGSVIGDGEKENTTAVVYSVYTVLVTMVAHIFRSFCGIVGANYSHSKSVSPR